MNRALRHSAELNFVALLKGYAQCKDAEGARRLHAILVANGGLRADLFIGSALIDAYAKCGCLARARQAFDRLCARNVVTWNTLITGYVEQGDAQEALECRKRMLHIPPDSVTFLCVLRACIIGESISKGQETHIEIAKHGLEKEVRIGSALVSMYSKSNMLVEAQTVFDMLPARDTIVWNSIIAGYVGDRQCEKALRCFDSMRKECKHALDSASVVSSLKACATLGNGTTKGEEIHMQIAKLGLEGAPPVSNSLIDMYMKRGLLAEAEGIFDDKLSSGAWDGISWNVLIAGYVERGCATKALDSFRRMQCEGICPDEVAYIFGMKACGSVASLERAREMHRDVVLVALDTDSAIGNTAIDMYCKCGSLVEARQVLVRLRDRTVVSWTALLSGYVDNGHGEEALALYEQMQADDGMVAAPATFACALKACTSVLALEKGRAIHVAAVKARSEADLFVGNSLIAMYSRCRRIEEAQLLFESMQEVRDEVSWNALIAGYAEHGRWKQALEKFKQMQNDDRNPSPGDVALASALRACACIAAIDEGRRVHAEIAKRGLEANVLVTNALIDMYADGGSIDESLRAFDDLSVRSLASWNALIAAYAQRGDVVDVKGMVRRMVEEDTDPNWMTFVGILNACSHGGLVEDGLAWFRGMSECYGIVPALGHCVCLADLVARAGLVDEAVAITESMPFLPGGVSWQIILAGCQAAAAGCQELGEEAFEHAMQVAEFETGAYVYFSNLYADDSTRRSVGWMELVS
jgi:pentatricopeptide repeat protein